MGFYYRANLLQIQVYYESLMVKQEDQILEFTSEDLIGIEASDCLLLTCADPEGGGGVKGVGTPPPLLINH